MTLPTQLSRWAEDTNYTATTNPTKSAMSAARVAQGFKPNQTNVAAQEANEYINRMGAVIDEHRDQHVLVAARVPGIDGPVTHPLIAQAVSGTYDWNFQTSGGDNAWGWRIQASDTAYFKLEFPPLARFSVINAKIRGIGTYSAPGWTGIIRIGQTTPGETWFDDYQEDNISSGAGASDWTEIQLDGKTYSSAVSTFNRVGVVQITAAADLLVVGFEADFEQYA